MNLKFKILAKSARDKNHVSGFTHNFYRYPARFSPTFASTAIKLFSEPGDVVLDPYMGGGTTIVEALSAGRRTIGVDLNELSVFITKTKTTKLTKRDKKNVLSWAKETIPKLTYRYPRQKISHYILDPKTKNMNLPRARFIKKIVAASLESLYNIKSRNVRDFIRCVILKTSQWSLDGRKTHTSLKSFRFKLEQNIKEMLEELEKFERHIKNNNSQVIRPKLYVTDTSTIDKLPIFSKQGNKVDLVVTSPPYPGLHILYHRWQVDGRRETPAPYWIAGCQDGQGDSYYNFGSRHQRGLNSYFEASLRTLRAIHKVMRSGALFIQMISFSKPEDHLPRYLKNMNCAGFEELNFQHNPVKESPERIWRMVPNRRWYANLKGKTSGSREVVLIHKSL